MTTYYGGQTATSNKVRPLSASSFAEFVTGFLHVPVRIRMTREAFLALPLEQQKEVKDGPYFCGCRFTEGTTERADRNAAAVVLVCLDLDPPAKTEPDPLSPQDQSVPHYLRHIHDHPDLVIGNLHPWNAAIYRTASSTPENPRVRVVVEADNLPPSKLTLRKAVVAVARALGIPDDFKGVTESTVLSQPMYRPVAFDGEDDLPTVMAERIGGEPLRLSDIEGIELVTDNDSRRYSWNGKVLGPDDPAAGLDQLPVFGLAVADILEPLNTIDPDCDRRTWINVAAALRHQFRDEDSAREAYVAYDEWSRRGAKYIGEKDTFAQWRCLRPERQGGPVVTIRTLFKHATDAGWRNVKVAELTKEDFESWVEGCKDAQTLSDQFGKRMLSLPFLNTILEDILLNQVRKKLAFLSRGSVSIEAVRKQLARERGKKIDEIKAKAEVPEWLQPWCYVADAARWLHTRHGVDHLLTDQAFRILLSPHTGDEDAVEIAKKTKDLRRPISVAYDPREPEYFTGPGGVEFFNTYRRHDVIDGKRDETGEVAEAMESLFRELIGGRAEEDFLKQFLGICVQQPGMKIRICPIIQSGEGAGKTLLSELLKAAIGSRNMKILNPAARQTGAWNDWAEGCHFVLIEELVIQGMNRVQVANYYKDFIANDEIALTKKFENLRTVPNVANAIAFTNSHNPIHLGESDRRYWYWKSPIQSREQAAALVKSGHFARIDKVLRSNPAGVRQWFLDIPIPDDFPWNGPAPRTRFAEYLINTSRNRASDALREIILSGKDPLVTADIVHEERAAMLLSPVLTDNYGVNHWLPERGLEPWNCGERVTMPDGTRTAVWVRRDWDLAIDGDPVAIMRGMVEGAAGTGL